MNLSQNIKAKRVVVNKDGKAKTEMKQQIPNLKLHYSSASSIPQVKQKQGWLPLKFI